MGTTSRYVDFGGWHWSLYEEDELSSSFSNKLQFNIFWAKTSAYTCKRTKERIQLFLKKCSKLTVSSRRHSRFVHISGQIFMKYRQLFVHGLLLCSLNRFLTIQPPALWKWIIRLQPCLEVRGVYCRSIFNA